jgi:hypothetical protein
MKDKFSMFLLLSILISLGISICGQTKTGTIRGVLTDSQGAAMPRQKIVMKTANAEEDDKARYAVTDFSGAFEFSTLPIGKYLLEFTMPGFEGGFRKQVSLTVEHPSAADVVFVMEPCGDIEASEPAAVTDKEKGEIVRQMLAVYLPKNTVDTKPNLSTDNIREEWVGEFQSQFTLLPQEEINKRGQTKEVPYLRISGLKIKQGCAAATLADLVTTIGNRVVMSGGAKTYEFRKIGNHWLGKVLMSVVF